MAALAPFAIPLIVGSTAVSAMSAIAAGNAAKGAYNFNAQQQEQQGQQQRNIDIGKAQQQNVQNERNAGSITAAYGAAGVDPSSGTPLEVMSDQAAHGELNRQLMLWQGIADQQSSDTQASGLRAQGQAAQNAGYNSAIGSLFSGAASAASVSYLGGKK